MIVNKIFNWTFGSLFRTIGRLLGFLIVCILLVLIGSKLGLKIPDFLMPIKINAAVQNSDWLDSNNINMVSWGGIMDCTSASNCSSIGTNTQIATTQNKKFMYISATEQVSSTASGGGYGFYYNTGYLMKTGYLYNITTYVCSTKGLANLDFRVATARTSTSILTEATTPQYQYTMRSPLSTEVGSYCYAYQSLVVPNDDSQWFRIRLYNSATTSNALSLIGYSIEGLGIYTNSIQDIITNSDLATNEDLTNVTNEIKEEQQNTTNAVEDMNNTINNNDSSGATGEAGGFFENFNTETFGLTSIITAPLNAINNILSSSCSSLSIPLPFVNKNIVLPCMTTIYSNYFGGFFQLYQLITTGIISYYIIVRIFNLVKDFKNPDHDEIEVVDL